jgi:hypothetical protein
MFYPAWRQVTAQVRHPAPPSPWTCRESIQAIGESDSGALRVTCAAEVCPRYSCSYRRLGSFSGD